MKGLHSVQHMLAEREAERLLHRQVREGACCRGSAYLSSTPSLEGCVPLLVGVPAVLEGRVQLPLHLASLCTLSQGGLQLALKAADFTLQLLLCLGSAGLQILQLLLER